jgi:hypothetical protein
MNQDEQLQLQKMIAANGAEDFTEEIRQTKHSNLIRENVKMLLKAKTDYSRLAKTNKNEFENICLKRANWLFLNYPDIYNRVYKDELNIQILDSLLRKLGDIENGLTTQHEASVEVGKILKEMYVDSALRKADNIEKAQEKKQKRKGKGNHNDEKKPRNISYADYVKKTDNQ